MLSREQFDSICKAFVQKHELDCSGDKTYTGWSWKEHPTLPRFGFLARERSVTNAYAHSNHGDDNEDEETEDALNEVDDPSVVYVVESPETFHVSEFIVFSATFQVPTFMFSVHTNSGCPVSLDTLLGTTLFHGSVFAGAHKTTFALQTPNQPFPMLSQAEHPTTGAPCWSLHPCATDGALKELLEADEADCKASFRLLELWLLLIGNVVDLSQ